MRTGKKRSVFDNHPILWLFVGFIAMGFLAKCCNSDIDLRGPQFPMDDQASDDLYIQEEYLEGKAELEQLKSDPCAYDIYMGVPPEYQRCGSYDNDDSNSDELYVDSEPSFDSSCSCSGNTYNCSDFGTQREAQACFDRCIRITSEDIHWLDDDGDGKACELNP